MDQDCSADLACMNGQCSDPCSVRKACGRNALCTVVLHKPRCECPNCYVGRAHVACRPSRKCDSNKKPDPLPQIVGGCKKDADCSPASACNRKASKCFDPCTSTSCDSNKQCVVSNHKATCQCKYSLVINQQGALTCPDRQVECRQNSDCPSNQACDAGACKNPCSPRLCAAGKECQVQDHRPYCVCADSCNPSVSICLRDKGCPENLACKNFQCVNPCEGKQCPDNTPCEVVDHQAVCKFCPPGFITDANYGCIKGRERTARGA